ncbi:uncharacterized protein LOC131010324 [Salvia miltiorrhiza]|uniref:uncharacterized protein LOC131010324 n=1 Tax=Salvia miltiorrhiza TaxID=226208 RepID=UPI0025AD648F|nr:uncharacterized protein LOC131010324 [Salvia miltiorrhiza]
MADRRSLFSRFWPPSASRRTPTTQTTAAPPPATTTKPKPQSQSSSQTSSTSSPPPPRAETKTPVMQSTTKGSSPPAPSPATPPRAEPRKASPEPSKSPAGKLQTKDEPETSSPSRSTMRSPSSSKPASPSRLSAQSRSPHQPPSSPQPRSSLQSPSRVISLTPSTPKRASKSHSPSRVTSRSPKQQVSSSSPPKGKQPASPSKDSTQPTEKISTSYEAPILASKENDPKPAASQQEAEVKEEVKPDSAVAANGQTQQGTSFKHDDVEAKPSQSSQLHNEAPPAQGPETRETSKSLGSSIVNDGRHAPDIKLDAKHKETKDVKEVVEATKTEAGDEKKKEVNDSIAPKSTSDAQIVEKAEIPREKQAAPSTKEVLATPGYATASQPVKKSKSSSAQEKPALPNEEHTPLHKNIKADMSKFANELAGEDHKKAISDRPVSVITIAGENRGASMHMESDSSKGEGQIHIHRSYKSNPDQSPEATTDGEECSAGKKSEDERSMEDQLTEAYVNNNAQGINNSIVFNSSIVEGSPGVHMVVSHLPKEPIRSKDEISLPEARKAEVNTSRAEKLTYQPTIRRRCLRGLLLETSDSDQDNPEKPRRHGCRVACQKEDRKNNIDVL